MYFLTHTQILQKSHKINQSINSIFIPLFNIPKVPKMVFKENYNGSLSHKVSQSKKMQKNTSGSH